VPIFAEKRRLNVFDRVEDRRRKDEQDRGAKTVSVAVHHDQHHSVLFPGPRLHQGREQDATKHQSSAATGVTAPLARRVHDDRERCTMPAEHWRTSAQVDDDCQRMTLLGDDERRCTMTTDDG